MWLKVWEHMIAWIVSVALQLPFTRTKEPGPVPA